MTVLEGISSALEQLQHSKGLLGVTLILVFGLGIVLTMIGGEIRATVADRRYRRWEREAEPEVERIRHGWDEENSDEWSLTNETYHAAAPRQQQRVLNEQWRERVNQAAYRSNEWPQQRFTQPTAVWPTWTEAEKAIPGRHRFDDTMVVDAMPVSPGQGYTPRQLRALVEDTGMIPVYSEAKELVGVGQ